MTGIPQRGPFSLSRRDLLRRVGIVGAAVVVAPVGTLVGDTTARPLQRGPLATLTAAEADTLDAIVARLIPSDETGPGAREAGAVRYIDRALGGALAASREAYRLGLAALDEYARTSKGAPFVRLADRDQDAVLGDMERNAATGFAPSSSTFFNLLRSHTLQGTFGDPYYGGNADFVGWKLIGYPGIRLAVAPAEQRLDPKLTPTYRSAYEHAMFSGRPPRASRRRAMLHGA
jgi:gluconate 2-dehydrogenase gamma chain